MNPIQRSLRRQIGVKSTFSYSFKKFSLFSTSLAVLKFIYPDGEHALSRHGTSMSHPAITAQPTKAAWPRHLWAAPRCFTTPSFATSKP